MHGRSVGFRTQHPSERPGASLTAQIKGSYINSNKMGPTTTIDVLLLLASLPPSCLFASIVAMASTILKRWPLAKPVRCYALACHAAPSLCVGVGRDPRSISGVEVGVRDLAMLNPSGRG